MSNFPGPKPYRFDLLNLPRDSVVLVLAPHPDDFDAIGVTLRRFQENHNPIHVAVLSACSGVEDSFCAPPTPENKAAIRVQEQRESCQFFGLPSANLEFPSLTLDADGQPADEPDNTHLIQNILARSRPDWAFLPHGNDTNSGHRQTWSMFRRAAAALGHSLTACYNHDPKTISLRVDAFTLFGADRAGWKAELLRFHRSQQHRNLVRRGHGLDDRILAANREMATKMGFDNQWVEAFELESFKDDRLTSHITF